MVTEYRYNAERDRIERYAWNPSFFQVQYDGTDGPREAMYWSCTSHPAHIATIAEKGKNYEEEQIIRISGALREHYAKWLLGGNTELSVNGVTIPGEFVIKFLIAEVNDAEKNANRSGYDIQIQKGIEGDLSPFRERFLLHDPKLLDSVLQSYQACQPQRDVIRVAELSEEYSVTNPYSKEMLEKTQAKEEKKNLETEEERDDR